MPVKVATLSPSDLISNAQCRSESSIAVNPREQLKKPPKHQFVKCEFGNRVDRAVGHRQTSHDTRTRNMPSKILFHDLTDFRHYYWEGWPEARIAREFRVSRRVVRRLIREMGLLPRDYYASNRFLADERSLAERRAYTAEARACRHQSVKSLTLVSPPP